LREKDDELPTGELVLKRSFRQEICSLPKPLPNPYQGKGIIISKIYPPPEGVVKVGLFIPIFDLCCSTTY